MPPDTPASGTGAPLKPKTLNMSPPQSSPRSRLHPPLLTPPGREGLPSPPFLERTPSPPRLQEMEALTVETTSPSPPPASAPPPSLVRTPTCRKWRPSSVIEEPPPVPEHTDAYERYSSFRLPNRLDAWVGGVGWGGVGWAGGTLAVTGEREGTALHVAGGQR